MCVCVCEWVVDGEKGGGVHQEVSKEGKEGGYEGG